MHLKWGLGNIIRDTVYMTLLNILVYLLFPSERIPYKKYNMWIFSFGKHLNLFIKTHTHKKRINIKVVPNFSF